ncbi:MAG TPA: tetratricopeptide repeat protein [Pyrinomonadaceae bacterium]
MTRYFISYSPTTSLDFALTLCDDLVAEAPSFDTWMDKRDLKPGVDWDKQVLEAISACDGLIFAMTPDSVEDQSVCKPEWTRALRYKKAIVPLKCHPDVEAPFLLSSRQYIDFTGNYKQALAKLRNHLRWLASPEGVLQAMKDQLADAERDLRRAVDEQWRARVLDDIALLRKQIAQQEELIRNPGGVARRVEQTIALGLERERQPEKPKAGLKTGRFINPPPGAAPRYFQNRHVETRLASEFLKDAAGRLLIVVGRGGTGKTAMVCRLLKSLEGGGLPDDGGALEVDGIVYLSANGSRRVTTPNLYADLCKLLPESVAAQLDSLYKNPQVNTAGKMGALLAHFTEGRTVLLLDNFEDVLNPETADIKDAELDEALRALLTLEQHSVKVILTTRIPPHALALVQPGRQARVDLDEGLDSPYAENILRQMDTDGKVGLRDAPDELLAEAREHTRGYPRALEALFAILSADRSTTLREVLEDAKKMLPENVVRDLVGEAFSRLDPVAQQVMQALAVYRHPVRPAAVDYLLQPYRQGVDSAAVLSRLFNMHFVRKEAGRYYLHPVDRAYAFERIPEGSADDRDLAEPPYTQYALLNRAAEYFRETRLPRDDWKSIEDLAPQLAEFDLRCEGHDYDAAAEVLMEFSFDYLYRWGYYRLMIELHGRLSGKLSDDTYRMTNAGNLGSAYKEIGLYNEAIACGEQALEIARASDDAYAVRVSLGNIGIAYRGLGQVERAMRYAALALEIARAMKDSAGEGYLLGLLAACYGDLGEMEKAAENLELSMKAAREAGDKAEELMNLGNLGVLYGELGEVARALDYFGKCLVIARGEKVRRSEGIHMANMTEVLIDGGSYREAIKCATEAAAIGEDIGSPDVCNYAYGYLALAHLYAGQTDEALAAVENALRHNDVGNNHYILSLKGVALARRQQAAEASKAFSAALAQAETLLVNNPRSYKALDTKGVALCGTSLCEGANKIGEAVEAFRGARAICNKPGTVGRILRLLDALAASNAAGALALAAAREAAAGK